MEIYVEMTQTRFCCDLSVTCEQNWQAELLCEAEKCAFAECWLCLRTPVACSRRGTRTYMPMVML